MARKLRYPIRRMVAITVETNDQLLKVAVKHKIKPAEKAREYIEQGVARDLTQEAINEF